MRYLCFNNNLVKMSKANYEYEIDHDYRIVQIVDLNQGGMTVTNDIENVINEICQEQGIDAKDYRHIYRDSAGIWDQFDWKTQTFISLNCLDVDQAVIKINQSNGQQY